MRGWALHCTPENRCPCRIGDADQLEQLRLGRLVVDSGVARQMTLALEIGCHAPLQRVREFFDIRVLERQGSMESWRKLCRTMERAAEKRRRSRGDACAGGRTGSASEGSATGSSARGVSSGLIAPPHALQRNGPP